MAPKESGVSVESICKFACGFYSFLAVAVNDNLSKDGHAEAMSLASCLQKCTDTFGSGSKPPDYAASTKPPPPSAPSSA